MKFIVDRIKLWKARKNEREEGFMFDSVLEMLAHQYPNKDIVKCRVRRRDYCFIKEGKDHYFIREDVGRLRRATLPTHYKCDNCGIVKGMASIAPFGEDLTGDVITRYSCRICKRTLYEEESVEVA